MLQSGSKLPNGRKEEKEKEKLKCINPNIELSPVRL
jgi:hypothetical protein